MPSYLIISPKLDAQVNSANALTKRLLCSSGPRKACGKCVNCLGVKRQIHPDLHILTIEPEKKQIGIDAAKSLISKVKFKPYLAKRQVAVIIEAQRMTTEAQNALLKTLEEPTESTDFILTVDDAHNVLPTIRSRCAPILLKPSRKSQKEPKEKPTGDPEAIDPEEFTKSSIVDKFLEVERIAKRDAETRQRVEQFLKSLTNYYYSKLHEELRDTHATQNNIQTLKKIEEARYQISRNVNRRLALENLMLYIPD